MHPVTKLVGGKLYPYNIIQAELNVVAFAAKFMVNLNKLPCSI